MHAAAAEEIRLGHAASVAETALAVRGQRMLNAEAFQRILWRHRAEIVNMIDRQAEQAALITALTEALAPFARCAMVLAEGQNPVLISLPADTDTGRTFVQLRPAEFRRAVDLLQEAS